MSELDRQLFDEYKRLDRICRDMLSCQQGVSEYIKQMEQVLPYIYRQIPSWDKDYRTLKRLRHLRNQIAHETSATDCDIDDIEALADLYDRILTQQDPLAAVRQFKEKLKTTSSQKQSISQLKTDCSDNRHHRGGCSHLSFIFFGTIALITLLVLLRIFIP